MGGRSILIVLGLLAAGCDPKQPTLSAAPPGTAPLTTPPAASASPSTSPISSSAVPSSAVVPAAAPTAARSVSQRRRYVVAALGDSITDARNGGGGYLAHARSACPQSTFVNFGKGGDMVNQMLRRFNSDVLPAAQEQNIDTLIVYGGVNDLYSDLTAGRKNELIERDLSTIYRLAKMSGLRVVAITVSPWGGFSKYWNPRRGDNTRLLNSWLLGAVAKQEVDVVVDSYPLLSCGDPDRLCPEFEARVPDGLHLGAAGHARLGQKLVDAAFADCL